MARKKNHRPKLPPALVVCSDVMTNIMEELYDMSCEYVLNDLEAQDRVILNSYSDDPDEYDGGKKNCLSNLFWWADVIPIATSEMFHDSEWNLFNVAVNTIMKEVKDGHTTISEVWSDIQDLKIDEDQYLEFDGWKKTPAPADLSAENFVHYVLQDTFDTMYGNHCDFEYEVLRDDNYFRILTPELASKCTGEEIDHENVNIANNIGKYVFLLYYGYPVNTDTYDELDEDGIYIETADSLLKRYKDLPRYIGLGESFETIDEEFQFSEFFGCIYRAYKIATLNGVSDEDFKQTYRNLFTEKK